MVSDTLVCIIWMCFVEYELCLVCQSDSEVYCCRRYVVGMSQLKADTALAQMEIKFPL